MKRACETNRHDEALMMSGWRDRDTGVLPGRTQDARV